MMGVRRKLAGLVAGLGVLAGMTVAVTPPAGAESAATQLAGDDQYRARIIRTEHGVPHVTARDLGGAGYGFGYAFAQDNLCVLADTVLTVRGERSAYFGPDAIASDGLTRFRNADSDTYHRAVNTADVVRGLIRTQTSPESRRLVAGYVAGVNRYLRDTGVTNLPDPTCRGKAWVRPVTELDIWRNLFDVNQLGGTSSFVDQMTTAHPPAPGQRTARGDSTVDEPARDEPARDEPGYGSNGWALGSRKTVSGGGMVLANPHFPWHGPRRFYQVQLTVPGNGGARGIDVSGVSLYGMPAVVIGHNASLAWTHTVSTAQRYTLFQLRLRPGDPTSYLVDGKPEKMRKVTVSVPVRGADGKVSTVDRAVYRSRYGPVLADGWSADTAFAVRGANTRNLGDLDEWLAMGRARSVGDLGAVQRRHQALPFVNTMAADSRGGAYYADASVVPHVTDAHAKRCVDTAAGKARYPEQIVLDGARSACDWGSDADAIRPGILGPHRLPRLLREDYVVNSNESPWLTNEHAPLSYPRIVGDTGEARSLRDRLSHAMVADGRYDVPRLRATMLNNRDHSAELLKPGLVALCRTDADLVATGACRVLAAWRGRTDIDSRGAVLWREFYTRVSEVDGVFLVPFDPRHPLTTPNTLNADNPGVLRALRDAVARMTALGVPLDVPLGRVQRGGTVPRSLPVQGCPGGEGCFNVATVDPLGDDGRFGDVVHGSSFIMAVELTPRGPRGSTLLTYSQSSNPRSPYHADQTRLYARKQWVTDRFTPAEIAADPHARTVLVAGR